MLVNLSPKARANSQEDRSVRHMLRRYPFGKDFKRRMKKYSGFRKFEKYKPCGDEYIKDSSEDFNGCWILHNLSGLMNLDLLINEACKQNALDSRKYGFDSDEYWDHFGLCDNATQAKKFYETRKAEGLYPGNHVIILQPMYGGFRWHKWGPYIGEFDHRCEYFDDEEGIKMVYSFNIVRIK